MHDMGIICNMILYSKWLQALVETYINIKRN